MKKITLFLIAIFFSIQTFAQITLEHTYDSAGYYFSPTTYQQLYVVKLEVDSYKFVFVDRVNKLVRLYNLNHTFWKSISFAATTDLNPNANAMSIMYISQHLFDNDDEIEFLYVDQYGSSSGTTQVVNEDGSLLFTADNQVPSVFGNAPQAQLPIYNTSAGTKIILSGLDGKGYVYALPGTLVSGINKPNSDFENWELSNPYPNPADNFTKIDYELPNGINKGEIVFYNIQGEETKRFSVDRMFNHLSISTDDLPRGTYYYNLQTSSGISQGKKLVTIR